MVIQRMTYLTILYSVSNICAYGIFDMTAQLYQLYTKQSIVTNSIALKDIIIPTTLQERLRSYEYTWDQLSGYLQRALLWEAGLILNDDMQFTQIYVPCGKTMNQIYLTQDNIQYTKCVLQNCTLNHMQFTDPSCAYKQLKNIAQCAIDFEADNVVVSNTNISVWASASDLANVPDIHVVYHTEQINGTVDNNSNGIFSIRERKSAVYQSSNDCPSDPSFVIPCIVRNASTDLKWCVPETIDLLDLWLQTELNSGEKTKSRTKVVTTVSFIGIFLLLLLALTALIGWVCICLRQKQRIIARNYEQKYYLPSEYEWKEPSFLETIRLNIETCEMFAIANTPNESESKRVKSEIALHSDDIYTFNSFCVDQNLLMQRIEYENVEYERIITTSQSKIKEIWLGKYMGKQVVIKRLSPGYANENSFNKRLMEAFATEIRVHAILQHQNIVAFLGHSWRRPADLCCVTEYMSGGELASVIQVNSQLEVATWKNHKLSIALSVANALAYIHSLEPIVIHHAVTSHHILLSETYEAKLTDFSHTSVNESTSTQFLNRYQTETSKESLHFFAPEKLRGEKHWEKIDIFAFGILLRELYTTTLSFPTSTPSMTFGKRTFEDARKYQAAGLDQLYCQAATPHHFSEDCPDQIIELANQCLDCVPSNRPTAAEIVCTLFSMSHL